MAQAPGILGQVSPVGGTLATVYTVPSGTFATIKVVVCNRGGVELATVAVSPDGQPIIAAHYLAYERPLGANDSISSTAFTVNAGDIVRVKSANGDLSFTVSGIEEVG